MVLDFEKVIALPEDIGIGEGQPLGFVVLVGKDRLRDVAFQARRKRDQPLGMLRQQVQIDARLVVEPVQVGGRNQLDEVAVALLVFAQQHQVVVGAVGARLVPLARDIHLAADDGMHAGLPGGVIEFHRAEEVAVIGHGHRRHLLLDGELHQLIDIARPIQQRIVGVAMQVDEGHLSFSAPLTQAHARLLGKVGMLLF